MGAGTKIYRGIRVGTGVAICVGIGICSMSAQASPAQASPAQASPAQASPSDYPVLDAKVYDRAAQYLASNQDKLVLNGQFTAHWRRGSKERFTYRHELGDGRADFVEVWAATAKREAAFDQAVVAAGLSQVLGKAVEAQRLPFKDYEEDFAR